MKKTKVIIAGSRNFNDYDLLMKTLDEYFNNIENPEIVSGAARGADTLAVKYGVNKNIPYVLFPAQWNTYGKSAGYIRNCEMADYADELVCFWDGISRGTMHMINIANQKKLKVTIIKYMENELKK